MYCLYSVLYFYLSKVVEKDFILSEQKPLYVWDNSISIRSIQNKVTAQFTPQWIEVISSVVHLGKKCQEVM